MDTVRIGEVTLQRSGRCERHRDDEDALVDPGGGFWSLDPAHDLCSWCWSVVRAEPTRAPDADEEIAHARAGIGRTGMPCYVAVGEDVAADVARVAELVGTGDLPRAAFDQRIELGAWLEAGGVLPEGAVVRRDGERMQFEAVTVHMLELQLRGELAGPPLDPELTARMAAAADEYGVIHDPELADEWFAAIQAQAEAARQRMGWPDPIIERGPVFPSVPRDEESLG